MPPKVVHVTEEAHANAKAYCARHNLNLKDWVGQLIDDALRAGGSPRITLAPEPAYEALSKKKPKPETLAGDEDGSGPKPWEQPPFWKRPKEEATKQEAPKQAAKAELGSRSEEPSTGSREVAGGEVIPIRQVR